jgi:hypothetical protein
MSRDDYRQASHATWEAMAPERTRSLLEKAGFESIEAEEISVRFQFRDLAKYLGWATNAAGALAIALRGLPEDERAPLEAEVGKEFAPYAVGGGYEVPGLALCVVAS